MTVSQIFEGVHERRRREKLCRARYAGRRAPVEEGGRIGRQPVAVFAFSKKAYDHKVVAQNSHAALGSLRAVGERARCVCAFAYRGKDV